MIVPGQPVIGRHRAPTRPEAPDDRSHPLAPPTEHLRLQHTDDRSQPAGSGRGSYVHPGWRGVRRIGNRPRRGVRPGVPPQQWLTGSASTRARPSLRRRRRPSRPTGAVAGPVDDERPGAGGGCCRPDDTHPVEAVRRPPRPRRCHRSSDIRHRLRFPQAGASSFKAGCSRPFPTRSGSPTSPSGGRSR